jgi:hypothetical protein
MRGAQLRAVTGGQAARFTDGQDDQGLTCGRGQDDHEPATAMVRMTTTLATAMVRMTKVSRDRS